VRAVLQPNMLPGSPRLTQCLLLLLLAGMVLSSLGQAIPAAAGCVLEATEGLKLATLQAAVTQQQGCSVRLAYGR
jgi:hypothetical protein